MAFNPMHRAHTHGDTVWHLSQRLEEPQTEPWTFRLMYELLYHNHNKGFSPKDDSLFY